MEFPTTFFLYALTATLVITPSLAKSEPNKDYIRTSCSSTRYPRLCTSTLVPYASKIQTNPKLLASTALSVALTAARSTSDHLSHTPSSGKGREAAALRDCKEEVSDSVDQLQKSVKEMMMGGKGKKMSQFQVSNVLTWTSAALTDIDTCMEGFKGRGLEGKAKRMVMRSGIVEAGRMISNALAFVVKYSDEISGS
ncbi:Pectinesterase inhibitor 11 [Linum grandiflorum]